MVSGSRLLPGRKAISHVKTLGGVKEACVLATRLVTTAQNAAIANGMLAHADETDRGARRKGLRFRRHAGARRRRRGDGEFERAWPARQGIVEIKLSDGRKLRHHTIAVRGTRENPMTRAEVDAKSYELIAPVLGRRRARQLCDAVWNVDKLKDVRKLRPLLQA